MCERQDGCPEVPKIGSPAHGPEKRNHTIYSDFRAGCFILYVLSCDQRRWRGAEDQDCACGMYHVHDVCSCQFLFKRVAMDIVHDVAMEFKY